MRQIHTKFILSLVSALMRKFLYKYIFLNFSVKLMSFLCFYNFMNHRNKDYEEMELVYAGKMFVGSDYFMNIL